MFESVASEISAKAEQLDSRMSNLKPDQPKENDLK
jgi:hypothetical protein